MYKVLPHILFAGLFAFSATVFAQQDSTQNGDISTQKLIVIKPYSPSVSGAAKHKQNPPTEQDKALTDRQTVSYDIFSVPVASTFVPQKGTAAAIKRAATPDLYNSYLALGLGNYFNALAEFYSSVELDNNQQLKLGLEHHSSQGGIKNLLYDKKDQFYNTKANIGFNAEGAGMYWDTNIGLLHQQYNWYGNFEKRLPWDPGFPDDNSISEDPKHNYTGVSLDGNLIFKESVFEKLSLSYLHFADDYKSSEDRVILKPKFSFPLGENNLSVLLSADYLGGKFKRAVYNQEGYSWLNMGIHPSYNYDYGSLSFSLGLQAVYAMDMEHSEKDFHFYPKVKVSYNVAGDYFTLYGGLDGELKQNSYYGFTQTNPYVSPDLAIVPTDKQYDIYFGAKGKFTDELQYDIRADFQNEKNKALYAADFIPNSANITQKYLNFDRFKILYDTIKTVSLHGGLNYLYDNLSLGVHATVYNYTTKNEDKAWNLPELEAGITADYKISPRWAVGADFFYQGERKDLLLDEPVTVKDYFDANLRLNFQISSQFGLFVRGNNLFNNEYKQWYGYKVQGIQGMLGLTYQF